jgi:outer membrane protein assembly factor BamB
VVVNGKLFLTQGDQVAALDPDTGKEIWVRDLTGDLAKLGGHLGAPPSPAGDKLYLATATGQIIVLAQRDGKLLATIEIGSPLRFQPALAKGRLFAGAADGKLVSLDLNDPTADGWTMWGGGPAHNGN